MNMNSDISFKIRACWLCGVQKKKNRPKILDMHVSALITKCLRVLLTKHEINVFAYSDIWTHQMAIYMIPHSNERNVKCLTFYRTHTHTFTKKKI